MDISSVGFSDIVACLIVLGLVMAVIVIFGRRANSREVCHYCGQEMGVVYSIEQLEPPSDADHVVHKKFRVCKACGKRWQMKEVKKRKQ